MNNEELITLYRSYLSWKGIEQPSFDGFMRYLEQVYWANKKVSK